MAPGPGDHRPPLRCPLPGPALPGEALQHPRGGAEPPSFFPGARPCSTVGRAPARHHPEPRREVPARAAGGPDLVSAGVDNQNFPDCVALGFTPITTCTDLLAPAATGACRGTWSDSKSGCAGWACRPRRLRDQGRGPRRRGIRAAVPAGRCATRSWSALLAARGLKAVLDGAGRGGLYEGVADAHALVAD